MFTILVQNFIVKDVKDHFLDDDLLASDGNTEYSSNKYFDIYKLYY